MTPEQRIVGLETSVTLLWARVGKVITAAGQVVIASGSTVGTIRTKGSATITAANTAVTVTHGAGVTPSINAIFVTPNNNTTAAVGLIWVDTIGATTFQINCAVAPGASTLVLGWTVFLL